MKRHLNILLLTLILGFILNGASIGIRTTQGLNQEGNRISELRRQATTKAIQFKSFQLNNSTEDIDDSKQFQYYRVRSLFKASAQKQFFILPISLIVLFPDEILFESDNSPPAIS